MSTNNREFFGNASLQHQSIRALFQLNSFYINLKLNSVLKLESVTFYCISITVYFTPGEGLGSDSCMKGYKGMLVGQLCKTSKETNLGEAQFLLDH